ncbi:hypothetical protein D3C72_1856150 [compost metagenome]
MITDLNLYSSASRNKELRFEVPVKRNLSIKEFMQLIHIELNREIILAMLDGFIQSMIKRHGVCAHDKLLLGNIVLLIEKKLSSIQNT